MLAISDAPTARTQEGVAMTPHEHTLACIRYAAWKRQAYAALAPLVKQSVESNEVPRLTCADYQEAARLHTGFIDACAAESRQANWFPQERSDPQLRDEEICAYLRGHRGEWLTRRQIMAALQRSKTAVFRRLQPFVRSGQLLYVPGDRHRRESRYCWIEEEQHV